MDSIARSRRLASSQIDISSRNRSARLISSSKASKVTGYTRLCRGFGEAGVAINRFTGRVLDKQIEIVNEWRGS
jgi:hypothetical protein